ncbi:hypothetical protein ACFFVB_17550 [Formosa undariae]|uniref:SGNH/GDSL hydrolase family protein n=1 Tax=Formosa undariae TaxID=1325436 RepID=A0ABV5F6Z3_9FLAO
MKKFLNLFLLFCLPVLVVGCVMEFALRQIPNAYQVKSDYLETHRGRIKTLLLGSSHILYGVNPEYLTEEALNYGHVSQTIDIDYDILHRYISDLEALETVVLRLSYTTLFEQLKEGDEKWRIKDYTLYTDISLDSKIKDHFEILSVKLKYNLERIYKYYILNEAVEHVNKWGWASQEREQTPENIEAVSMRVAKKHTAPSDVFYSENYKILENIIKECTEKGIKVVLVTMPAYKDYIQHLDALQLEKTINAGMRMDLEYSNCTYLNYLNDNRFGRSDFLDADHLNTQGAEKFSKIIDGILRQ